MRAASRIAAIILCGLSAQGAAAQENLWRTQGGSIIELVQQAGAVTFVMREPNPTASNAAIGKGDTLFTGTRNGDRLTGTSFQYENEHATCRWANPTTGIVQPGEREIVFTTRTVTNFQVFDCTPNTFGQATFVYTRLAATPPVTTRPAPAAAAPSPAPVAAARDEPPPMTTYPGMMAAFDFHCQKGQGAPILRTAETHYYDFRGATDSRRLTLCNPTNRADCDDTIVHTFDLMCVNGVVTAAEIGAATNAALPETQRRNIELKDGRLYAVFTENREIPSGLTMGIPGQGPQIPMPSFRYETVRTGLAPLPIHAGPTPAPSLRAVTLPTSIAVTGNRLASVPAVPEPALWERLVTAALSWLKIAALAVVAVAGGLTFLSYHALPAKADASMPKAMVAFGVAFAALLFMQSPLLSPEEVRASLLAQEAAHKAAVVELARDEARLKAILTKRDGRYEPISETNLKWLHSQSQPRTLPAIALPSQSLAEPSFWVPAVPALIVLLLYSFRIIVGAHYALVRHPAEIVATPALNEAALLDRKRMGRALAVDADQLARPPPVYKSRHMTEKAQALKEQLVAHGEIAEKALEYDRVRAAQIEARKEFLDSIRHLPWWRRWWLRLR